jgi:hypothetical protein
MWPLTTFTIGFRGIMVIHRVETENPNFFEVGVVDDPLHRLRINTIENGMLAETTYINRPGPREPRLWTLEADNPIVTGVSTYTRGAFNRLKEPHGDDRDYRWIAELKDVLKDTVPDDFESVLITDQFAPVLRIYNGVFYTRVKSPLLTRLVDGSSEPFGSIAAVVACDIPMLATGSVRLVEQPSGKPLFTFTPGENMIYEFANTPDDTAHAEPHNEAMLDSAEDPDDPCRFDHFKSYNRLFPRSLAAPNVCFRKSDGPPAPDPATCGAVGSGGIKFPYGGGS